MSAETLTTLNRDTLIGFTDKRGNAWHYRAGLQGDEPNHYAGAIPAEDVQRRLFGWEPQAVPVEATIILPSGVQTVRDESRVAIVRPDTGTILGVHSANYSVHGYGEWLLEEVGKAGLPIGNAVLLKGGAVAAVQFEAEETVDTPEGVSFRPFVNASTSLDGSLASTYWTGAQVVICDNTLSAALSAGEDMLRIRHTRHSAARKGEVLSHLALVETAADRFAAQVADLCATVVTDAQWSAFLDAHYPMPEREGRGMTLAETARAEMTGLWKADPRCAPWNGTAWGVVQTVNTYAHHVALVRGADRATRNAERVVSGKVDSLDGGTLGTLRKVLETV